MIPIVLDTNVLVSAIISQRGPAALVVKSAREGQLTPYLSQPMIDEYNGVCSRPKLMRFSAEFSSVVDLIVSIGAIVPPTSSGLHSPDPSDTMFIDCAVAAGAHFLVTGNKRHFPEPFYGPADVVNAAILLTRIAPNPA